MFLTPWHNGVLNSTFFQVIKNLIAGEMTFLSDLPCFFQIRNIEVAHAPGKNHSITLQLIEGRYRFLERILTAPVQEIAIQSVRLEPNQGPLASLNRSCLRGVLRKNFRHQEDFVAPSSNRLTDQPFGSPRSVHLGGIDVVHTKIETNSQSGDCRKRVFALVVPGSLTDHRDVTPRGSEMALFHTCPWLEINLLRIADLGRGLVVFSCAYSE
jgi:hypothetical protein